MINIDVNGVTITLTDEQLKQIDLQRNDKRKIFEKVTNLNELCSFLRLKEEDFIPFWKEGRIRSLTSFEKYLQSSAILAKVAECYNEGTKLDWENTKQYKYIPYKYFSGGGGSEVGFVGWGYYFGGSGLVYYKSEELAKKSYSNFKSYWEDFWAI